jgi:hypothetical protein
MNYVLKVTPLREDRISLYSRLKIPTQFEAETFEIAQQMAALIFDLYEFKEQPMWQDEYTGEYSFEGEGFLIEIEKVL